MSFFISCTAVTGSLLSYRAELQADEDRALDVRWADLNQDPRFLRANAVQKATQQTFDSLRQANGGAFPRDISPVLYVIPLILVGVAEWYVNYSTFASIFVPVFAIAGTLLVGAIFAWASHMYGAYLARVWLWF
jgi:hypothetical protein